MKYHNHRAEPYFTFLKNGKKTIEGRIRKGWYRNVKPGDQIVVYNEEETDSLGTVVKRVTKYKSVKDMLINESIKKLLPDIDTIDQGIKIYRKFYTPEQEHEFGVVAIEVEIYSAK
ncbi:MAG: ASCH domain-containing protein [Patescibacteria group bacterium]